MDLEGFAVKLGSPGAEGAPCSRTEILFLPNARQEGLTLVIHSSVCLFIIMIFWNHHCLVISE